jgi:hypothetical protein
MPLRKRKTKKEVLDKENHAPAPAPPQDNTTTTTTNSTSNHNTFVLSSSPAMSQKIKTTSSSKVRVRAPFLTCHNVDAVMAGLGMSLGLYALKVLEVVLQDFLLTSTMTTFSSYSSKIHLSSPLLIGSSAIFFFNRKPPSLKPFIYSTFVGILMGQSLHTLNNTYLFHKMNETICIFGMMVYFKLSGNTFGAASAMAVILSTRPGSSPIDVPYAFILSPYLLGHLLLYAMACTLSKVRNSIRIKLMRREFFAEEKSYLSKLDPEDREKRLLLLFRRMDLSGDGRLDVEEFQAALKSVFLKEDVSLEDAQKIVRFVDQNGDGTIDFEEFCMAIEKSEEMI